MKYGYGYYIGTPWTVDQLKGQLSCIGIPLLPAVIKQPIDPVVFPMKSGSKEPLAINNIIIILIYYLVTTILLLVVVNMVTVLNAWAK